MNRPVSQENLGEFPAWSSLLDRSYGDADPAESREGWGTNPNTFPAVSSLQYPVISGSTGDAPENQPTNLYHRTPGQGLNNYQDAPVLDGMADSSLLSGFYPLALDTLQYHQNDGSDANANHNWMGTDCSNYQPYTVFPPTQPADIPWFAYGGSASPSPVPQTPHLDSGMAGQSYGVASGTHLGFGIAQATPIIPDEAAVAGTINPLLSPPAGMLGNQGATQVPAESPLVGVSNLGIQRSQRSNRSKGSASPYYRHEGKGIRRQKQRHFAARGQTQTTQAITPLPTRPGFYVVEQTVFQSQNVQNDRQHLPSICFTVLEKEKGRELEGINLEDALKQRYSYLEGRDDPMFEDESIGNSISCRMEFVGHSVPNYKTRQIMTKNYKKTQERITKQKLAYDVAKLVKGYLEKGETPFHIRFEDMFLMKLHHVARASWQPELWYRPSFSS